MGESITKRATDGLLNREADYPFVSVIVNNYNGLRDLKRCLKAVLNTRYPEYEVIVVDSLTPGIQNFIRENFPAVNLIHSEEDRGPSDQRNVGLRYCSPKFEYAAFVDDDVRVDPDWLLKIIQVLETDPTIAAVQPLLLREGTSLIDNAGLALDSLGYSHRLPAPPEGPWREDSTLEIDVSYGETAALVVRRKTIEEVRVGGESFDSTYFIHWYDVDFSWRLWLAGYRVVITRRAVAHHSRGVSSGLSKLPGQRIFLNTRNRIMTLLKNYGLRNLVLYLPLLYASEILKALALLRIKREHVLPSLQGLLAPLREYGSLRLKRAIVQGVIRQVPDIVATSHFIRPDPSDLYANFLRHYAEDEDLNA